MPTGNAIVDRAIEAHGREARWRALRMMTTTWTFHGMMFKLRLRESQLRRLQAKISLQEQRVEIEPYPQAGSAGIFTPNRVELRTADGVVRGLDQPRDAFSGLGAVSTLMWWTDFEMLYFAGYVLWNYSQLPFLLLWPGLTIRDAGTTRQQGETWNKVAVSFPKEVATHSPEQTFYFGPDGLLRRHDYYVGIMGRLARGARLIHATQNQGGLVLPSRIEIKLGLIGESYAPFPSLGFVDFDDTRIE